MSKTPYTFAVLRYVHDRAAAESLNVGVLLYAPTVGYIGVMLEPRFERLSRTFSGFDGEGFRSTLSQMRSAVDRFRQQLPTLPGLTDLPTDAGAIVRMAWPDLGLSFEAGPTLSGLTSRPMDITLKDLFARMVTSQAPQKDDAERRSDQEVWSGSYQAALRGAGVSHKLGPRTLVSPDFEIRFDYGFDNERTHVVQPITMDFVRSESLRDKATHWVGTGMALKGHPKLGQMYLLLGEPRNEEHRTAYDKAKNLLHKMPVKHEIVEEREATAFAEWLASYMREHGILEP